MEPRTVRNFKLVEPIGSGGMGVIYRAVQISLDRPVAIKELHAHLAKDADFIRRFEREAKSAAALHHENIVSVIDFGQEGPSYFLALEFIEGADLKELLSPGVKVPLPIALTIAVDVLRGLEHAHARGVVHRDIKPANVLVSREGIAKVADFSIARAVGLPSVTVTGETLGTPAYMSPEQAAGKGGDPRGDLFSVGVILFEMLAGRRPFEGDSYPSVLTKLLTTEAPRLSEVDPSVPGSLSRLVAKALDREPTRRFQGCGEMRAALEGVAAGVGISLRRDAVAEFVKSPRESSDRYQAATGDPSQSLVGLKSQPSHLLAHRTRSPVPLFAAGVSIALAAVAFASWRYLSGPDGEPTPVASALEETSPLPSPSEEVAPATPAETGTAEAERSAIPSPRQTVPVTVAPTRVSPLPSSAPSALPTEKPGFDEVDAVMDPDAGDVGLFRISVPNPSWAEVWIDGRKVDTTPVARAMVLSSGPHLVALKREGWKTAEETVVIHRGKLLTRTIELQPSP